MMLSANVRNRAWLRRPWDRRGSVLVLTAVLIVVLVGMLAFAIDVGYLNDMRTELQRTADASALAAAQLLPDVSLAAAAARTAAAQNGWSSGVTLGPGDELNGSDVDPMTVEVGYWNRDAATFTSPAPPNRRPNAVRVTLRRTEATGNPLHLFFAPVLGQNVAELTVSATA